jgi:hypothetical protein
MIRCRSLAVALVVACSATPVAVPVSAQEQAPDRRDPPIVFGDPGEHAYTVEFFPGATHDPAIATPESVLGVPVGTRPATHAEVLALWNAWDASPRVVLEPTGETYEGRRLVVAIVSSPENVAALDSIRERLARLADPRGLSAAEEEQLVGSTPPVAWLGYSIHGDEMSGVDGGLAFAHHLIASTDQAVLDLLAKVVVVIDPMMNPDGRERFLSMLHQTAGYVPNLNAEAFQRGRWPGGRGNHYLFDMNRDWMPGVLPETRARWRAGLRWRPQLFVDAHEMGGLDTYLFSPPREPINPHLPEYKQRWGEIFAADQARAFDRHGWSYYTREWFESWYPGYSDAWGSLHGAVGILYEQASLDGQSLRRASGEVVTYREAAHHQAVSSLANVTTLAANGPAVLRDYVAGRRASLDEAKNGQNRMVVVVPSGHPSREERLVRMLVEQGVEVFRHTQPFTARNVAAPGATSAEREVPAGALVIPVAQPAGALVRAYLELDPRFDEAELLLERRELEKKDQTRIYDVTAWNPALALDLDVFWADPSSSREAPLERVTAPAPRPGGIQTVPDAPAEPAEPYGWLVDGRDDAAVVFAARAMELGLQVRAAEIEHSSGGHELARGSLLVRRHENDDAHRLGTTAERVRRAAEHAGVLALPASTARSADEGPDLGAPRFGLLARPRVALLTNSPVSPDSFGHVWHHLDRNLALPVTLLDAQSLGAYDLRRYNVLVIPPAARLASVLKPAAEELKAWVRAGGTLIALGSSAAALADAELGLSQVRRSQDVLSDVDEYLAAARREAAAEEVTIDAAAVWEAQPAAERPAPDEEQPGAKPAPKLEDEAAKREDEWQRRFAPNGVILRARIDRDHWLSFGCGPRLPVFFDGATALLARDPVRTAVRLAPEAELRIAGLVWPEARARLAESAYLTSERLGRGQVILFASHPAFRGMYAGTARLLSNAVVYGPGLGADAPLGW